MWANGTGSKKTVSRSAEAIRRLGVTEKELAAAPQISGLLKRADGGLKQVIAAMRLASEDEVIASFLKKYDSIPSGDRERLPLEAIALAASVDISSLLGSILLALQSPSVNLTKIIALTNHSKITTAHVRCGLLPSGERDRTAIDSILGALPSRKMTSFIGQAIFGSGKGAMDHQRTVPAAHDDDDPDLDRIFPPAEITQEKLTRIRESAAQRRWDESHR
jgi:hypothetical protein